MDRAVIEAPCHDTSAAPLFHDEVERKIFDEERCVVPQALSIEGVQHRMTRSVSGRTCALDRSLSELLRHAAERALVDLSFLGPREGNTEMFEFVDSLRRIATKILDRILVTQPVRALHGVIHVPAPVVGFHVAQRSRDTTLRGNRMATGRKNLADIGNTKPALGSLQRRPQAGATGTDDNNIKGMVGDGVSGHGSNLGISQ